MLDLSNNINVKSFSMIANILVNKWRIMIHGEVL